MWADGDPGFYELNDALQHLGNVAFRPPVPAYRHSAALFLRLRGWVGERRHARRCPPPPGLGRGPAVRSAANGWASGDVNRGAGHRSSGSAAPMHSSRGLAELGISLPFTDPPAIDAVAEPVDIAGRRAPNRFAILPMEGWDGTDDGRPTDLVRRRWARSVRAAPAWCGAAKRSPFVPTDAANPRQLCARTVVGRRSGRAEVVARRRSSRRAPAHALRSLGVDPRPGRVEPLLDACRHGPGWTDAELDDLADAYAAGAALAHAAGFDFVDVKACHGYLQHELLGGPGIARRARPCLETTIERIRAEVPGMDIGVRLSVFDVVPHHAGPDGRGEPDTEASARSGSIAAGCPALLSMLDVDLVCVTAGSPYYCPHVQRPAYFPPSDGYQPPEDPLVAWHASSTPPAPWQPQRRRSRSWRAGSHTYRSGCRTSRPHWCATRRGCRRRRPAGLELSRSPCGCARSHVPRRRRLCRTFSDCTTAPRNGLVSGCWPLDDFYKDRPERVTLAAAKRKPRRHRA